LLELSVIRRQFCEPSLPVVLEGQFTQQALLLFAGSRTQPFYFGASLFEFVFGG
jgi:hypothetical protein